MNILRKKFNNNQEKEFERFLINLKKKNFQILNYYKKLKTREYLVNNPKVYFGNNKIEEGDNFYREWMKDKKEFALGEWVVFEDEKKVYHLIDDNDYLYLRTVRNRGIISREEQDKLYSKKILVIGLSVGSNILEALVRLGVGNNFIIFDDDEVDVDNFNRAVGFNLDNVNKNKAEVIAKRMFQIDPYIKIDINECKADKNNIENFIKNVDLIIDTCDSFAFKITDLRDLAKKYKKPIVTGFDVNRGVLLVVERYDLDKNLNTDFYLNGEEAKNIFRPVKNVKEITDKFVNIIGRNNHDEKMLKAVYEVGSKYTGYPQLCYTTMAFASYTSMTVIDILLGNSKKNIRKFVNFGTIIE